MQIWAMGFGSYIAHRFAATHPERLGALATYTDVYARDPANRGADDGHPGRPQPPSSTATPSGEFAVIRNQYGKLRTRCGLPAPVVVPRSSPGPRA
ncbi:MAG TPA: hypothetical protein VGC32_06080 [Solirubrobacterales bacterium]